ncbi:MarR family winged helix-turn-helix transcriptional regulator [Marinobacterium jannaschii]|uniref:MarR family winged helix-turn-helix transcriptional regulator n=1 Tax=Marinobacterium jannaschii TaxID=64970 RepID=UPI00048605A3|nr:MarR family transcriptional regulator [Marinobacterium jannaschii]
MFFLKELPTRQMIRGYAEQYPSADVDSVEQALKMMRQASLLVRRLETYFSHHGISQQRFLILIVLDREPERTSLLASEIAERVDVSRPVMTRTLRSLVDEHLITLSADTSDKRAKQVSLTEKGKTFLAEILPGYFSEIDKFMKESAP